MQTMPDVLGGTARVLLVDDDPTLRRAAARVLVAEGFDVVLASDGREALERLATEAFDVVVSDVLMPNMTGLELLRAIRERDQEIPVVLLTGTPSMEAAAEAKRYGALHYLTRPVDNARLAHAVTRAERLRRVAIAKRMALDALGSGLPRAGDLAGLGSAFERALSTLWMAYQPIVRAKDGTLYGHEALMRSREATLPHPGAVLEAAERLGRLDDVGRRVRQLAPEPLGRAPAGSFVFVNLHASDLNDPTLLDPASPLVAIAPRVVLEITERATLDSVEAVEDRIAALRGLGFRIAIDDLGAGYAGLTSFALLEPEVVKLDMTLIRDIASSPTKYQLVRSVTGACKDLGVLVVAEGIETVAERQCLVELGCDLLQGYLFARPGEAFPTFTWGDAPAAP